jgi:transcriptional regulator with XRE-family HTH domain
MLVHMAHQPDQALARAIAEVLQEVRTRRGMSTRDIADFFGVADVTVGRWESGARQPALDQLPSFDRLAGHPRGHVLRLAGYVSDLVDSKNEAGYDVNLDDPDERHLWAMTWKSEETRWKLIQELRSNKKPARTKARRVSGRRARAS